MRLVVGCLSTTVMGMAPWLVSSPLAICPTNNFAKPPEGRNYADAMFYGHAFSYLVSYTHTLHAHMPSL